MHQKTIAPSHPHTMIIIILMIIIITITCALLKKKYTMSTTYKWILDFHRVSGTRQPRKLHSMKREKIIWVPRAVSWTLSGDIRMSWPIQWLSRSVLTYWQSFCFQNGTRRQLILASHVCWDVDSDIIWCKNILHIEPFVRHDDISGVAWWHQRAPLTQTSITGWSSIRWRCNLWGHLVYILYAKRKKKKKITCFQWHHARLQYLYC